MGTPFAEKSATIEPVDRCALASQIRSLRLLDTVQSGVCPLPLGNYLCGTVFAVEPDSFSPEVLVLDIPVYRSFIFNI